MGTTQPGAIVVSWRQLFRRIYLDALADRQGRERHGQILREAAGLVEAGKLRIKVDSRRFGLGEVNDAFVQVAEGRGQGKTVVEIGIE
ncbi:zinc-binding dehydrogenase [Pseudomonas mediterranea]|uniref:zinc-binding dehydrogenase n=1 Tax=Pseudomonas mediterranea TaxID=183795 RepID=UPI003709B1E9